MRRQTSCLLWLLLVVSGSACASLEGLRAFVQPPRFEQAEGRRSNPNGFGLTLGTLRGTLHLEGSRAATVNFPLGLPLEARGEAEIPIDIIVDFRDVPGLSEAITRARARQPVAYELEGTIGVSAGAFGEPVFGPMTILRGEM